MSSFERLCFGPKDYNRCTCATCLKTTTCDQRCQPLPDCEEHLGSRCPRTKGKNAGRVFIKCTDCLAACPSGLACFTVNHCDPVNLGCGYRRRACNGQPRAPTGRLCCRRSGRTLTRTGAEAGSVGVNAEPMATPEPILRRPARAPDEDVAHRQTLRLTFTYDGDHIELVQREPVDMTIPPSAPLTDEPPRSVFWYELQNADRTALYRRTQRHPLRSTIEIRTGDPERPLAHVDSRVTTGTFTLVVPHLDNAEAVVLCGWDTTNRDREPETVELARFPLGAAVDDAFVAADTIPPTTVSDAVANYRRAAVVHLRAFDNTGNVARTVYRVDDGDEHEGLTVTVDAPGRHQLAYWSIDPAGNVETENVVTFTVGRPLEDG